MEDVYDVIIIGSGPGGLTAAMYSGRYARKTVVIGGEGGGVAGKAGDIENWPGIKKIKGLELMHNFREHAKEYGVEFIEKLAVSVKKDGDLFVVDFGEEKVKGKTIIFALGTRTNHLEVPGEERLSGRGVSYCATCDGMFFRGKDVVIIGGADAASKAAIYLGEICNSVKIIYRKNKLRGEPVYLKKIEANPKIELVLNSIPIEIIGENKVEAIKIKDKNEKVSELKCDGVFVEIGAHPCNKLASEVGVECDSAGYTISKRDASTNVPGIYAIGDMTNTPLRQIVTAAGDGATAANSAHEYLNRQG